MKIFFPREKNDKDIEDFYFPCFFWQKCAYQDGESDRRAERYFVVNVLKFESDIKLHSNNKVIIIIRL